MPREYFLTASETICTGLTAGNQSDWFPVTQNLYHTFFIILSGIDVNIEFEIQHCPVIDGNPGTTYIALFSGSDQKIIESEDGTQSYFFNGVRTGFIRINFINANGGTPTIDGYYYGGR